MDILSTPSPRHANDWLREGDIMRILDDVSRMNLDGSSILPRRQSLQDHHPAVFLTPPPVNRRRPSIVVTPPQQCPEVHEEELISLISGSLNRKRLRGTANRQLVPMLPDSKDFSTTSSMSNNVYGRHIPMFSPIGGVSKLNMDFISKLETSSKSATSSALPPKGFLEEMSASTTLIVNSFPTLEDDEESIETKRIRRNGEGSANTARVLKMRRRCKDEYELWDAFKTIQGSDEHQW